LSLASRLAAFVDPPVRYRGESYEAQRRVNILRNSNTLVEAVVRGTMPYAVTLNVAGSKIVAACECPFAETELCKHIWAVIRACDRHGHLRGVVGSIASLGIALGSSADEARSAIDSLADNAAISTNVVRISDHSRRSISRAHRAVDSSSIAPPSVKSGWQSMLLEAAIAAQETSSKRAQWANRELVYVIQTTGAGLAARARVHVLERPRGNQGRYKPLSIKSSEVQFLPSEHDRAILGLLGSDPSRTAYGVYGSSYGSGYGPVYEPFIRAKVELPLAVSGALLLAILRTGRAWVKGSAEADAEPKGQFVVFDDETMWEPQIDVDLGLGGDVELRGWLVKGDERLDVVTPELVAPGAVVARGRGARVKDEGAFAWVSTLRSEGVIDVSAGDVGELLTSLLSRGMPVRVVVSPELGFETISVPPIFRAHFRSPRRVQAEAGFLVEVEADYDGTRVPLHRETPFAVDPIGRRLITRAGDQENMALELLSSLGARPLARPFGCGAATELRMAVGRFPEAVRALVDAGWRVEADGKLQRAASDFHIDVTSGIDWFDFTVKADFGGASPAMADLLAALRQRNTKVVLDDGSHGLIPEEWLRMWGVLAQSGTPVDGRLRFRRGQAALLDVLLAERATVSCDETFTALRRQISGFNRVEPRNAPKTFRGTLRDYQKDALGWFAFLRDLGLGGCLADDMGLGKTVQVLAMLLARKDERKVHRPSLVVVPRSLLFNWREEAARFAPNLSIVEYFGRDRSAGDRLENADIVLTTYGVVRGDIHELSAIEFDYVILDEATAIKTSSSATAKAARLLRGAHRLALTGTPIENHVGELWSLFEFLNPGMLGSATWFRQVSSVRRDISASESDLIRRAIRPFVLRRTKAEVATELPPRVEQTVLCDLDRDGRSFYDKLKAHVRASVKSRVERNGIGRSTVHILEGLLRLRQAACHPGLIDKHRSHESSAKLDVLFEQLAAVLEAGEKAIVFSQFTSLLALVRRRLEGDGITHEYLDGATRDRKRAVDRFQKDGDCSVFVISLKAGGVGLNLTAANYVFLLDPWWNPAVEAQAIDRAHRIGQIGTVFAYRIIARDTVEEKVAELQKLKRDLADAVLGESSSGLRRLTRADLDLLLS
jgi:superfamily II DNA or RNA helicase